MGNLEKAFLVVGIILLVIGLSLMVEGQVLGDRTIPASVVLTLVGTISLMNGIKTSKS